MQQKLRNTKYERLYEEKKHLRLLLRQQLRRINSEQRTKKSKNICQNLISTRQFQEASAIMFYLALAQEADTAEAIIAAWKQNKTVIVPQLSWQNKHMLPVRIHSLETEFSTEVLGLRNPVSGIPVPLEQIDLVLAPALGFDRNGNRLGRGGSYYDHFFTNKKLRALKCGFAFTEQIIDSVPVTPTDVPMDFLVTDQETIYCNMKR